MKTKRFLKVLITALVCIALIVPVFQVASAGGNPESPVIYELTNPNLYWALIGYGGSVQPLDPGHLGYITLGELNSFNPGSDGSLDLDGDYPYDHQTGKLYGYQRFAIPHPYYPA